jgi:hypothetical protein
VAHLLIQRGHRVGDVRGCAEVLAVLDGDLGCGAGSGVSRTVARKRDVVCVTSLHVEEVGQQRHHKVGVIGELVKPRVRVLRSQQRSVRLAQAAHVATHCGGGLR